MKNLILFFQSIKKPKQQPTPQQISAFVLRKFSAPEIDLSNLTLDELWKRYMQSWVSAPQRHQRSYDYDGYHPQGLDMGRHK